MDRKQFREAAFAKALQAGCTGAELVVTGGEEFGAGVQAGKLDTYTVSRTQAFGLRVQYKGKNGYASTEAPEDPGALVAAASLTMRMICASVVSSPTRVARHCK